MIVWDQCIIRRLFPNVFGGINRYSLVFLSLYCTLLIYSIVRMNSSSLVDNPTKSAVIPSTRVGLPIFTVVMSGIALKHVKHGRPLAALMNVLFWTTLRYGYESALFTSWIDLYIFCGCPYVISKWWGFGAFGTMWDMWCMSLLWQYDHVYETMELTWFRQKSFHSSGGTAHTLVGHWVSILMLTYSLTKNAF
eukprot:PhF_6_TR6318/c0_g1_i2/m.9575